MVHHQQLQLSIGMVRFLAIFMKLKEPLKLEIHPEGLRFGIWGLSRKNIACESK
jgi:hypothetical protein